MAMNEKNETFALPVFDNDSAKVQALLKQIGGKPNKTVLIAPYATTSVLIPPPDDFWTTIVSTLQERGYTVVTNCSEKEVPLKGTSSILIPYAHIVPFLDTAGYFIGVRSGLCDIISTTKAKKIILHPYEAQNWPDGASLAFTGLNNMGLCDNAIELEATPNWNNVKELENRILCEIN